MKISIFTLGCKTNQYESMQIAALLALHGYDVSGGLKTADVFVINTCAVTKEAEKKSRQAIARAKKLNPNCQIVVVGCASQKEAQQFTSIKNVAFVKGVSNKENLLYILAEIEKNQMPLLPSVCVEQLPQVYTHSVNAAQTRTRAFVKIQDGCNNFCSYCIVPYLRGASRSKKAADAANEVKAANAAETVLIGIDISQYGKDTGESLQQLFLALQGLNTRIRLGSLEHSAVTDGVLSALSKLNFCPHFHLSLQSGSDGVLKRMNRHYTAAQFLAGVQKIRNCFPDAAITTDIIAGFPGETEEEFLETCKFVNEAGFADIHVFPYSRREGTAAYNLPDTDDQTKKRRVQMLSEIKLQQKQLFLSKKPGKTEAVLVERQTGGLCEGYAPDYTRVYFYGGKNLCGSVVNVKVTQIYKDGVKGETVS